MSWGAVGSTFLSLNDTNKRYLVEQHVFLLRAEKWMWRKPPKEGRLKRLRPGSRAMLEERAQRIRGGLVVGCGEPSQKQDGEEMV